jgi:hypothetical protein
VGSASASALPTANVPQSLNTTPDQRFVLGEEEMVDVGLATFHLFDKENGTGGFTQVARGCGGCGGCRGCGGGCRGCGGGCRGCGCRDCGCGGCGGGWGIIWGRLRFRRLLRIVGRLPFLLSRCNYLAHRQNKEGAMGGSTNGPPSCLRHSPSATCLRHAWPLRDCPPRPSRDSVSERIVCGWRCLS